MILVEIAKPYDEELAILKDRVICYVLIVVFQAYILELSCEREVRILAKSVSSDDAFVEAEAP